MKADLAIEGGFRRFHFSTILEQPPRPLDPGLDCVDDKTVGQATGNRIFLVPFCLSPHYQSAVVVVTLGELFDKVTALWMVHGSFLGPL